jgi:hypothetical protein
VPLAVDEGFAGFALRLQQIEFLIEPLPGGFAGVDRTANPCIPDEWYFWLTASSTGLSAGQNTRTLGQAKEPWTRPMRPGDPLGDHRQRAIVLALIVEPVIANEHGVGVPAPLTHTNVVPLFSTTPGSKRAPALSNSSARRCMRRRSVWLAPALICSCR